jgi:hypothetical protein
MASSLTLTTLRDRVEQLLLDTANAIWSTGVLDEAIRQALHEYSKANQYHAIGTITLSARGYELDISSLTGLLDVQRVWLPYTAASPENPPNWRRFEFWRDPQKLFFIDEDEPQSGQVCRVFYTKLQTLNGLDSAASTTFPADDDSVLTIGGAGFAASSRSVDTMEKVTLDRLTSQQLRAWGLGKLQEFRAALNTVARRESLRGSPWLPAARLDRYEERDDRWG